MQYEQRFASIGISLRHSLHFLVVGSVGGSLWERSISIFIGLTTKKNTATETKMKEMRELIK